MKLPYIVLLVIGIALAGCSNKARSLEDFKDLDLTDKGVPITIKVPSGTDVIVDTVKKRLLVEKSLELVGDRYHVRVEVIQKEYSNPSQNPAIIKQSRLELEERNIQKGKFIENELDEPHGFVYQTRMAPKGDLYHFFYTLVKDGKQIEITDYFGLEDAFTKEEALLMYQSVKQEK